MEENQWRQESTTLDAPATTQTSTTTQLAPVKLPQRRIPWKWVIIVLLFIISLVAGLLLLKNVVGKHTPTAKTSNTVKSQDVDLGNLANVATPLKVDKTDRVIINGQLQSNQGLVLQPTDEPSSPVTGQVYINSKTGTLNYFNGTKFVTVADGDVLSKLQLSVSPASVATTTPTFAGLTLTSPLPVSSGGTGLASLPPNRILTTDGSGALTTLPFTANGILTTSSSGTPTALTFAANGVLTTNGSGTFTALTTVTPNLCLLSTAGAPAFASCGLGNAITIGALDSQAKSVNGAVIVGPSLYLQSANASFPGLVTTGVQTFAGNKTFNGATSVGSTSSAQTLTIHGDTSIQPTAGNDSPTAFQVQSSLSNSVLKVDTTYTAYCNLLLSDCNSITPTNYGDFENNTAGSTPAAWVWETGQGQDPIGANAGYTTCATGYFGQNGTTGVNCGGLASNSNTGSKSMLITTGTASNDGVHYVVPGGFKTNTSYVLSMWVKSYNNTQINDIVLGHNERTIFGTDIDIDCPITKTTAAPNIFGVPWNYFVCSFTTSSLANLTVTPDIYVRRTNTLKAVGVSFYVDTVKLYAPTGSQVTLGDAANNIVDRLQFAYDGGISNSIITLQPMLGTGQTAPYLLTLPTETGVICTTASTSDCSVANDGKFLSKAIPDIANVSVSSGYLYTFTNTKSAGTGGVLQLSNGTNTGPALLVNGDQSFGGGNLTRTISVAQSSTADTNGGTLKLVGGMSKGAGTGGTLTLQGGATDNSAGGNGGDVNVTGGAGSTGAVGNGGSVNITGGARGFGAVGGDVNITGGASGTSSGNVTISGKTNSVVPLVNIATAFNIYRADGTTSLFNIDTANNIINVANNTSFIQSGGGLFSTGTGQVSLNGSTTIGTATTNRLTVTAQLLGASPLVFQGATDNAFTTTLSIADPTANHTITLPDAGVGASDTICLLTRANCTGVGSGATLQAAYDASTGGTTPEIKLDSTRGAVDIQDANSTIGANLFNIWASGANISTGNPLLGVSSTGAATFSNTVTIQGSNALTLGTAGTNTGAIVFRGAVGAGTLTLQGPTTPNTGNFTLTIPTIGASAIICTDTGNCNASGSGGAATLQTAYNASVGGTTSEIILDTTRNGLDIQDATAGTIGATKGLLSVRAPGGATTFGASLFVVQGNGRVGINNGGTTDTTNVGYDLSFGQIAGVTTDRTIGVETQTTAATGGNGLAISAGTGNTTGAGGNITLQTGAPGNTGANGTLIVQGTAPNSQSGVSNGISASNILTVTGVAGGIYSDVNARTGGTGAGITLTTGAGGAATGLSGNNVGGVGGTLTLQGGAGGNVTSGSGAAGVGGAIAITAGAAGTGGINNIVGGAITLTTGAGNNAGAGGTLALQAGSGGSASGVGGAITVTSGAGSGSAASGNITLQVGTPGATGTNGQVIIQGTAPSMVAGTGTAATAILTVTGVAGGATSSTTSQLAGIGSAITLATGNGGAATGASSATNGGAAGTFTIQGGTGGAVTNSASASARGGAGAAITVIAGNGGSVNTGGAAATIGGAGGIMTLQAGNGGDVTSTGGASGTGGSLQIISGSAGNGGVSARNGGAININTGFGNLAGHGGDFTLTAGQGGATGNGGNVNIQGGATNGGTGTGGNVTLTAGTSNGTGVAGTVSLQGGTGATVAGGAITITGGTGGTNSGGGQVTVVGGTAAGTGTGGLLSLQGGPASATAGSAGGGVTLQAANGTGTTTGGVGGAVQITAGNGTGTGNRNGGNITLQAGSATGTGTIGTVLVKNAADSATAFNVQNAAGTSTIFTVDTSNSRVGINTAVPTGDLSFGNGASRTINVLQEAASTVGDSLTVSASAAGGGGTSAQGVGGLLTLQGGAAGTVSGAGTGNVGAVGGGVTLQAANGSAGVSGSVNQSGGAGGAINILSGVGGTNGSGSFFGGNGGAINVTAGNAIGAATGGAITLSAGAQSNGTGGLGSSLTLSGGSGTSASGGGATLAAGNGNTGNNVGGALSFQGGTGKGTGGGGGLTLQAGAGGDVGGGGGPVSITSGSATAGASAGGNITITAGNATTSGSGGTIILKAGSSPTGTVGGVTVQGAANSTTAFQVQKSDGTVLFNVDTTNGKFGTPNTTIASTNSQAVVLQSGDATGSTSNSGNITLDVGTATGTVGSINIGTTNALTVTIGKSTGTLTVNSDSTFNGNLTLASGRDIKLAGSGNARNAVTKDFTCTSSEVVNDIVIITGSATVGRTTTAQSNRVAGVVVAKPISTTCTVAIAGEVQVWFSTNATPVTIGDPVETSTTTGAAQSTTTPVAGGVLGNSTSSKDGSNLVWVLLRGN